MAILSLDSAPTIFSLARIIEILSLALVFFTLVLPTGSIFGLPYKHLLVATIFCLFFMWFLLVDAKFKSIIAPISICVICILCCSYSILGIHLGFGVKFSVMEMSKFFSTFFIIVFFVYLLSSRMLKPPIFFKIFFIAIGVYSLLKGSAFLGHYVGLYSETEFQHFIATTFAGDMTTLVLDNGMLRIMFMNDILLPFALFFFTLFYHRNSTFPRHFFWFFVLIITAAVLISYSRTLYLLYLLTILLLGFVFNKLTRISGCLSCLLLFLLYTTNFGEVLHQRFFSDGTVQSDQIRMDQFSALISGWRESPIFGHGMGSFKKDYIRSSSSPFSYELQWISFLFKFGVAGLLSLLLLFFLPIAGYFKRLVFTKPWFEQKKTVACILMYSIFGLSALSNPYLFSSPSAFIFVAFIFYGRCIGKVNHTLNYPSVIKGKVWS